MLLFSNLKKYLLKSNIYFNNVIHHTNNIKINSSYYLLNYVLDLPSVIDYYESGRFKGQLKTQIWYKNGNKHREGDLPAFIQYHYKNIKPEIKIWYKNGKLYRVGDLPARIEYYENGQPHRKFWYKNEILHREGDLSNMIEYGENGRLEKWVWYKNGEIEKQILNRD